ncbi:proprotein convertase P-domain-containing protein [Actinomycetospora lutea]|uniref:proprotein convertase P-domain-containing protein n=1 Tax=Actinomycetospora lutea TaxID=663604 RepID=UPI002365CC32|nr:proprotein convertase P-domain-containing protein [Actinomycetospora lutea]MDD7937138.1 proprotein convertase P-domain-containing protein [Actinomycetospora lutea]
MSTVLPPSWSPGDGEPSSQPTSAVGQGPAAARPTTVVGHTPPGHGGAPPAFGQAPSGPVGRAAPAPGAYPPPPYIPPPTGTLPGVGSAPAGPPPPRRRGWIGWLVGGVALVLVAGIVAMVVLLSGGGTLIGVSTAAVPIPDADPAGVTDVIALDGSGQVQSIHVEASLTHPFTCDVTVTLISPQGTPATLADPQDCSRANPGLQIGLDSATPGSPLAPFVGEQAGGQWRLQVVDGVGIDQGQLTGWGLTVRTD